MIESVSTSQAYSPALRNFSQGATAHVADIAAPSALDLPTTRIRVDNNLDRAIIEVRAADSGEILRQYPTQAQLRAFARAEEARSAHQQEETREAAKQKPGSTSASSSSRSQSVAPAPAPQAQSTGGGTATSSSYTSSQAGVTSTQSIDV